MEISRACIHKSNFPVCYGGECLLTSIFLINRFPSSVHDGKTPYELIFVKGPRFDFLKYFGCLCFASTLSHDKEKLEPRALPCVFLVYPPEKNKYTSSWS